MSSQLKNVMNITSYSDGNANDLDNADMFDLVCRVEQHAADTPDKMAVSFGSATWTYQELMAAVDRLAHRLRLDHIGYQDRIALCAPPDLHAPVALLAALKLGAVYIPIGADYPVGRIQAIIEDVKPAIVLTVDTTRALFAGIAVKTGDLPTLCAPMDGEPHIMSTAKVRAGDDAFVFYTSGTTGEPKGIAVGYGALDYYIRSAVRTFEINRDDVMTSIAKYSFSISLFELLPPLVGGGRLMLLERDQVMAAAELTKAFQQATIVHIGPSLLRKTLSHIKESFTSFKSFERLRHISTGGDVVPPDLLEMLKPVFAKTEIFVIYGCSEISCMGTNYFVPRDQTVDKTIVGKAFDGAEILLLGEDDQPVAHGDVGEVLFASPGLLNGYINKPELTAEKHIVFGDKTYFRTGDVGRLTPSDDLELLGRRDFQVKIRGLRIEPVEVEIHLRRVPGVREAVVAAVDHEGGEKKLAAYLVIDEQAPPSISNIRSHLGEHLPEYMIPSVFALLESLPLNQNLKVDRKAVPALSACALLTMGEQVAPRNETEAKLVEIWRAALGHETIGVTSNFFDLGGDSLLAVTLCLSVSETFDVALRPSTLYETSPTIEELARLIDARRKTGARSAHEMASTDRTASDQPLPILPPAIRFLRERDNLDPHRWNVAQLLQSDQPLDPALVKQAVIAVAKRHDALDMRLTSDQTHWFSLSEQDAGLDMFVHVDLSIVLDQQLPEAISDEAERQHANLDLQRGPVARVIHIDLGPDRPHRLLVMAHHLAVDGTSWPVLIRDITWTYEQLLGHRTAPLVERTGSYRAWGQALRAMGNDPDILARVDDWTKRPWEAVKPLPRRMSGANTNQSVRTVEARLDMTETQQLRTLLPRGRSATEILIPTLARAVGRWAGSDWVLIDSLEDGRNLPNVDMVFTQSIGFMGCYIPLMLNVGSAEGQSIDKLGTAVRSARQDGYTHDVLRYLADDPTVLERMSALPRAEIIFNYGRNIESFLPNDTLFQDGNESHGATHHPMNPRDYHLGAVADRVDGEFVLKLVYSENLNDRSTIQDLLDDWVTALRNLL